MNVDEDFVCEHGMTKPWATCVHRMYLPEDERPVPPRSVLQPPRETRSSSPARGSLPKTDTDPWPALTGNKDISYPVHDIDAHVDGPGRDWLLGEHGFPKELRNGGWVYLRHDGRLSARARIRGIGFRNSRPPHTGDSHEDFGPGPTLELDPNTWQRVDHDLGELAESQRQGYRYLITCADGSIRHLTATDAIPDDITPDEPHASKLYKLTNSDGKLAYSWTPGIIGGNSRSKIWGNLDCSAALAAGETYAAVRVFFASIDDATLSGFRPCGTCRPHDYAEWKATANE